jgi:hypothetical protein
MYKNVISFHYLGGEQKMKVTILQTILIIIISPVVKCIAS